MSPTPPKMAKSRPIESPEAYEKRARKYRILSALLLLGALALSVLLIVNGFLTGQIEMLVIFSAGAYVGTRSERFANQASGLEDLARITRDASANEAREEESRDKGSIRNPYVFYPETREGAGSRDRAM